MNKVRYRKRRKYRYTVLVYAQRVFLVDWASLAQQWIKMKETTSTMPPGPPVGQQVRPTPREPTLLRPSQPLDPQGSSVKPPNKALGDHNTAGLVTG